MRTLRNWWRNFKHSRGDCPGAWGIDCERHVATCHFCGFEDHYGQTVAQLVARDSRHTPSERGEDSSV